jgi:hypothetical protein
MVRGGIDTGEDFKWSIDIFWLTHCMGWLYLQRKGKETVSMSVTKVLVIKHWLAWIME